MVAAAIVGAGVVGAVGSGVAGSMAAGATENATNASIAQQRDALAEQATLSAPYRQIGTDAMANYEKLLGIGPTGSAGIGDALAATPGYQFTKDQGIKGITNQASLSGGVSGNTLAALDEFNTGLASTTYQQNLGDLAGAIQTGQAAAAGQAQNVGTGASNIGSALINEGSTMAGIDANTIAGITKSIGNASDSYVAASTLAALNK